MNSKKVVAVACLVFLLGLVANFGVFVFAYDHLAVPFLSEEQRVTNANFIMNAIVPAFAGVAALVGTIVYWTLGTLRQR